MSLEPPSKWMIAVGTRRRGPSKKLKSKKTKQDRIMEELRRQKERIWYRRREGKEYEKNRIIAQGRKKEWDKIIDRKRNKEKEKTRPFPPTKFHTHSIKIKTTAQC